MKTFAKKLSIETPLSYEQSKNLVQMIKTFVGDIEEAKEIYESKGYFPLLAYCELLPYGIYQKKEIEKGVKSCL